MKAKIIYDILKLLASLAIILIISMEFIRIGERQGLGWCKEQIEKVQEKNHEIK